MTLSGAVEQKVWMNTYEREYFPNLYALLVGEPGSGKSFVISEIEDFWEELKDHKKGKSSLSRAALSDMMNEAHRSVLIPGDPQPLKQFNTLLLAADEFSVLMPAYDNDMIPILQKLYDRMPFSEKKRTAKIDYTIQKPQLVLVAGTQPGFLSRFMPESAWDEGFISRTIMVYSGDAKLVDPFGKIAKSAALRADLVHDLKLIAAEWRNLPIDPEARTAAWNWIQSGMEPKPSHPKLRSYNSRRTSHLIKLCMLSAVDLGHAAITLEDFQIAQGWLIEVEAAMPDIFKAMSSGGAKKIMEETYHAVYDYYLRHNKKGMPHNMVLAFIAERAPTHEIEKLLDLMEKVGILAREMDYVRGGPVYLPKIKKDFT